MSLNVLSLFAGIGGLELGLERAGMTVVGQVEIDAYCRRVLAKHWPDVPRHDDVRTAAEWWQSQERPRVDVICGGFPCQDISAAGGRAGIIDGERSSMWAYLAHTVRVLRPRYVLVENVSALLVRGLDVVAADLAEIGYDLRWDCVPAAALGAPHRRDRWFGIAYPHREQHESGSPADGRPATALIPTDADSNVVRIEPVAERRGGGTRVVGDDGAARHLADTESDGCGQGRTGRPASDGPHWAREWPQALAYTASVGRGGGLVTWQDVEHDGPESTHGDAGVGRDAEWWATEPDVGRVADGVPSRVDRLRALGNAVVPQVAEYVGRLIVEYAEQVAA